MSINVKYWEKLLIEHRNIGRDSLTIPFIIGSQQFLKNHNKIQNIDELLLDIANTSNNLICLRYCMSIKTLILEIHKDRNQSYIPTLNGKVQNGLVVSISSKNDLGNTFEEIIQNLIYRFEKPILDKTFSANISEEDRSVIWENYSDKDIEFVIKSFSK
ncbi:hypothetical protein [Myroides odoratimimus]|uniref:hypothetical protein n=1 Tax=Myroides odoratimimus TaxID=76832 RepID=UPI002DB759AE|nr:hypothetical protein [Myroides odoratimimus]MEC4028947.1 hypothetical protein [Myroides odoratimimus]